MVATPSKEAVKIRHFIGREIPIKFTSKTTPLTAFRAWIGARFEQMHAQLVVAELITHTGGQVVPLTGLHRARLVQRALVTITRLLGGSYCGALILTARAAGGVAHLHLTIGHQQHPSVRPLSNRSYAKRSAQSKSGEENQSTAH